MTSPNEVITDAKLLRKQVEALQAAVDSGGGTGGIGTSIINAKGDLIVGTADDTVGVLPVGTDGQVLTADSTNASGIKWADAPTGTGGTGVAGVSSVNGRTGAVTLAKGDVNLGNVDNTSDLSKPVSTATQTALNAHANNLNNPHQTTKAQVGLGNVDNTSDASKPISTATQTALNAKADLVDGKVPAAQLPAQQGTGVQVWEWYVDTASQGAGADRRFNDSGQTLTIVAVRVRANIAGPVGQALIVDLNKNGLSVFPDQASQPKILDGDTDSGKVISMTTTSVADGDYLVPDIDQIGSTVPGSGILVSVTLR